MERIALAWQRVNAVTTWLAEGWRSWRQSRFWQTFWDAWRWGLKVLIRPLPTLQRAAEEKPVLTCLWLTIFQGLSLSLGVYHAAQHEGFVPSLLIARLPSWSWVIFYALVFPPAFWFLKAALLNLVAEILGGPPRGLSLLASTAIACSPLLLVFPVALVAVYFADPDLNTGLVSHLWFAFTFGVHVWWAILTVFAVRETYHFPLGKAFLTVLLPFLVGLPLLFLGYLILQAV